MIDFEHPGLLDAGDPVGTAVEAGGEEHDLTDTAFKLISQQVIDQPGPSEARRSRSRPPVFNEPRHCPTNERQPRQGNHEPKSWSQKADGEAVLEEPDAGWTAAFECAEQGHEFCRSAGAVLEHPCLIRLATLSLRTTQRESIAPPRSRRRRSRRPAQPRAIHAGSRRLCRDGT